MDGEVIRNVKAPDTITSWVASAFAVSDLSGLGVAPVKAKVQDPEIAKLNTYWYLVTTTVEAAINGDLLHSQHWKKKENYCLSILSLFAVFK